ncbi:MAG: succinate dehydrogenase iron-sulfur subunit [Phycisphaeraceae bacterium]|nr:succinate dehydrogenase iron-sulfur subunit [Phycisphaeraceae bacterium]
MIAPKKPEIITFRIKRQDARDAQPYWEVFEVPYKPNLNVISCLQLIAENPVTREGRQSRPVVWDCSCLEEVCGACTMVINGRVRQSCSALVDQLLEEVGEGEITLEPMTKFPVVRDLWVDRQRMFDNLLRFKGWVPIDGTHDLGEGPKESPEEQELRYELSRCMTCGCCLEACPQFTLDNDFIGANTFGQVVYFNAHKTGRVLMNERLDALMEPGGIADCGNAQNCVKVCPKDVPLTIAIAKAGRQTTVHSIKRFFTGKR